MANVKVLKSRLGLRTLDIDVASGFVGVDLSLWGTQPPDSVYENAVIHAAGLEGDRFEIARTRDGSGFARVVMGDYALHYGHLIGTMLPFNADARVGQSAAEPVLLPEMIDLQPGLLSGVFTQGGEPFPANADVGRFVLRDPLSAERVKLGESSAGSYQRALLEGSYDIVYEHVNGTSVVANVGARLGCVVFEPSAAPVESIAER